MKAVVAAFNQKKALVGAFSVITNLRMELFGALSRTLLLFQIVVQEMGGDSDPQGREILDILYATEEGFAVPEEGGGGADDPGY